MIYISGSDVIPGVNKSQVVACGFRGQRVRSFPRFTIIKMPRLRETNSKLVMLTINVGTQEAQKLDFKPIKS